ncbi:hypothetical protein HZB07_06005 [Candidatus Saganbacteria bacterium]|nr:hypothetical protein [Candidatus Saganbacteria bacterium]
MKKYWLEALSSFFIVGLGQAIKGHGRKAVNFLLIFYLVIPALIYLSLLINGPLFIIVFSLAIFLDLLLWLYNIWDVLVKS